MNRNKKIETTKTTQKRNPIIATRLNTGAYRRLNKLAETTGFSATHIATSILESTLTNKKFKVRARTTLEVTQQK